MDRKPKVSVILTSYNHEKYLAEALQSVLDQTFTDFELLIFDDGSQDRSQEILRSFRDPRIRLFLHEENRGPTICLKEVMAETVGQYVAIHHSDDAWLPEKLAKQVEFLESNEGYAACFTQVRFMDEESRDYELPENHLYRSRFKTKNRTREEWLHEFFFGGNCLCHPSLLIRREMYDECGLFSSDGIAQLPDFLMWVRLCLKANLYVYPEELVRFRLHTGTAQNTSADSAAMYVRAFFEQGFVVEAFQQLQDPKELLCVFPELQEYVIDGRMQPVFAFAQLCLHTERPQYMLKGLQQLYALLKDESTAAELQVLYSYTWKSFLQDTGRYDVFGRRSKLSYLDAYLYYDDGSGFSNDKSCTAKFYVTASGEFSGSFKLETAVPIRDLILNLNQGHFLKARLDQVLVNEDSVAWEPLNASEQADGFDLFLCPHPQYRLCYEGTAPLEITLRGCRDTQTDMNELFFERYIELGEHFQSVCRELERIQNTRGERFLRKLRHIRDFFKRS
jgi:glycosyltransferase involved in cell wall biosynthesis